MSQHPDPGPRGFRLIDLLVVAGIAFILLMLALPMLRKTREHDERVQCQNYLHQLALAVHNYASMHVNLLPDLSGAPIEGGIARPQSIFFTLLPYLEEEKTYDAAMKQPGVRTWEAIDPTLGGSVFRKVVRSFCCPMDSSTSTTLPPAAGWGGSSYAANAQVFGMIDRVVTDPAPGGKSWNRLTSIYNIGNIPDGTSNTIFIAERFALAGRGSLATPCAWANPPGGGVVGNAVDPLGCPMQTFVCRSGAFRASICGPGIFFGSGTDADPIGAIAGDGGVPMYPLPEIHVDPKNASTDGRAQSRHRAVVQVAMGDGSARGVTTQVSQVTWVRAICPYDGQPLGSDW
jgi:competence protein ComGC